MPPIQINSSIIKTAAYTEDTLEIAYHDGSVYLYFGVSEQTFNNFLRAESKGRYLTEIIKPKHQVQIVKQKNG